MRQRSCIRAIIRKLIPCRMPKHVWRRHWSPQEYAGRSAEPLSGPWISDRVLCRFSFLTLRGPNQHGAVRRASGQPTQRAGAPDVRHIIFGEAFRADTDTARLPRRLLDREALATRAIPDKIDHTLNWRGMQRIRIGRSLSE